ncbi:zinc metalloprotease HtpX [Aestuariispira ectoiniformans]|uniref:zinc metalloprotease HtpX n=1 Tax=Aestuariispira ectoiniformans TaxID=2775080 RepID=UPI00223B32A2|nr:zinc metalloprotease HtpX [Aestuariispira ectoiniformans]
MKRQRQLEGYKSRAFAYTILLIIALIVILLVCGWVVGGSQTILAIAVASLFIFLAAPRLSPDLVMRFYRGRKIPYSELPELHDDLEGLCRRAGLVKVPSLYLLQVPAPNALSTGAAEEAAIAVSSGSFRLLNERELVAVMAHEVAHIVHGDNKLILVTELVRQAVGTVSMLGIMVGIIASWLSPDVHIPVWIFVLLAFAPMAAFLCQRAISRLREFAADMKAVELMEDPEALVTALMKIDHHSRSMFKRLFGVEKDRDLPTLLQSHPDIGERIERLMVLAKDISPKSPVFHRRLHSRF